MHPIVRGLASLANDLMFSLTDDGSPERWQVLPGQHLPEVEQLYQQHKRQALA